MQRLFGKYLCAIMLAVTIFMAAANYLMVSRDLEERMVATAKSKTDQIIQMLEKNDVELENLKESLSEDYLTRCQAFAYIINQNPEVLNSQYELQKIKRLLNVDELHVIDGKGILRWGTIPKYFGMDFASTEQTAEFLQILDDPDLTIVQDIQPNGAEQKIFQYVGVAREDEAGIVQVGLNPTRYMEAVERNELSYIFENIMVTDQQFVCAADAETNEILGDTLPQYNGHDMVAEYGVPEDYATAYTDGGFIEFNGQRIYYVTRQYGDIVICIGETEKDLYADRAGQMWTVLLCLLIMFAVAVVSINILVRKKIINGVNEIATSVAEIQNGNLETIVQVDSNPEFRQLSEGINQMVGQIIHERDYDSLTGLRSRRSFEQQVCAQLQEQTTRSAAMIMMDLDNFKSVNDSYGHAFGDQYLKLAAQIMLESFPAVCVIGRRSGDEFYIFWKNCENTDTAVKSVQHFYENLKVQPIASPNGEPKIIRISSGVAFAADRADFGYDALLSEADAIMYKAKERFKGTCCTREEVL